MTIDNDDDDNDDDDDEEVRRGGDTDALPSSRGASVVSVRVFFFGGDVTTATIREMHGLLLH